MIYVNGDSYSAVASNFSVYSVHLEQLTGQPVTNSAKAGSSNDRIIRTAIEDCLVLSPKFAIIGLSFITREEVWWNGELHTLDKLKDSKEGWNSFKDKILDLNINHQTIHFYTKVYMLSKTFEQLGIDYLIFSAANNAGFRNLNIDHLKSYKHVNIIWNNPKIINFHSFNIPKWANDNNQVTTKTGHLATSEGHAEFAKYLYTRYL
jgi:hypothetical protein